MGDRLRKRIKKGSADWDRVLAVNLKGPFLCTRAAAQHLEGGGAIVNVASLAGRSSSPLHGCHYSASKARLDPPPCARTWAAPEALRFPRHWPHLLDRGSVTHQHWYGRGAGSFFRRIPGSFFKTKRTADGSADRHAWSSGTMGEKAGAQRMPDGLQSEQANLQVERE